MILHLKFSIMSKSVIGRFGVRRDHHDDDGSAGPVQPYSFLEAKAWFDRAGVKYTIERFEERTRSVTVPIGSHPFPFRTRKLSLLGPMVLAPNSVLGE